MSSDDGFYDAISAMPGKKELLKRTLDDDELFELRAKTIRKQVDKLMERGFTVEQAVTLAANMGIK